MNRGFLILLMALAAWALLIGLVWLALTLLLA
jgi:hypothetical protein